MDDRDRETKRAELKAVSFWIPDFTPEAKEAAIPPVTSRPGCGFVIHHFPDSPLTKMDMHVQTQPPKRPRSPMSGQPLRTKDLVAVDLIEDGHASNPAAKHYICPVSRDQITTQKVVVLKT